MCVFTTTLTPPTSPRYSQVLDLRRNTLGDAGARALSGALHVVPTLQALNLRSNCIGVEAKSALRAAWGVRDSDELKL